MSVVAAPALAQDEPRFALVTSFPTPTVSFEWELTEQFAVRVSGSYTFRDESTSRVTSGFTDRTTGITVVEETVTESTVHTGSVSVSGLFTIHRSDQLGLYLAPRVFVSFSKQTITATTTMPPIPANVFIFFDTNPSDETQSYEDSSTSPGAGLAFGASTNIHRRLALFGEAGGTYSTSDSPTVLSALTAAIPIESTRTSFNTYALAGIKFLF